MRWRRAAALGLALLLLAPPAPVTAAPPRAGPCAGPEVTGSYTARFRDTSILYLWDVFRPTASRIGLGPVGTPSFGRGWQTAANGTVTGSGRYGGGLIGLSFYYMDWAYTFDTRTVPDGCYDLSAEFYHPLAFGTVPSGWSKPDPAASYGIRGLYIHNQPPPAPAPPTGVTVTPDPAEMGAWMRVRWNAGAGGSPAVGYEVRDDGAPWRVPPGATTTIVLAAGSLDRSGPRQLCVVAVGAAGTRSAPACVSHTVGLIPTRIVDVSWAGPLRVRQSASVRGRLLQTLEGVVGAVGGARVEAFLGGRPFATGRTDANGYFAMSGIVPGPPGPSTTEVVFPGESWSSLAPSRSGAQQVTILPELPRDVTPPSAPSLQVATAGLSWSATFSAADDPGGSGIDRYVYSVGYQRETVVAPGHTFDGVAVSGGASRVGARVPGVAVPRPGTYFFLVRAVDKAGNSSGWASRQFTIQPPTPSLTLGNLPDPLRIGTVYAPSATLFDPATAGYAGRPLASRGVQVSLGNTASATVTNGAGTATFYGFTPVGPPGVQSGVLDFRGDASGEVGPARIAFSRTVLPADQPPSPPTGLAARPVTLDDIELSWAKPTVGGLTWSYRVGGGGVVGYEFSTSGSSVHYHLIPGITYTLEVRARDSLGRFSDYARLAFTPPAATTALSNWVWTPVPARLGSIVSTRVDLTASLPAGVFAQPASRVDIGGLPVTFSLGSQTFGGYTPTFSSGGWTPTITSATVQAGPGTLPTSVAYAGSAYYTPARLTGTLTVLGNDTTPPSVPVVSITPSLNAVNAFSIQASTSDNAGGSGVSRLLYRIDGGAEVVGATYAPPAATGVVWGFQNFAAPSPGVHTFQARAIDAAGNASAYSVPVSFEWRRGTTHWSTSATPVQSACVGGQPVGTFTVKGTLLDQSNRPLGGRYVSIAGGGVPGSALSGADGSAVFAGRSGGSFTLTFAGDNSFDASSTLVTTPALPPCAVTPPPPPPPASPPQPPASPPAQPPVPPPAAPVQPPHSVDIPIG